MKSNLKKKKHFDIFLGGSWISQPIMKRRILRTTYNTTVGAASSDAQYWLGRDYLVVVFFGRGGAVDFPTNNKKEERLEQPSTITQPNFEPRPQSLVITSGAA